MSDKGLVKHSWLCIWALQCLPRGLCFCKPLHTPPELRRLREDLVYLSLSTAVCWPSPYSATLWCVCVLTCRILLPLSPECRSQAGATLLDLCRPFLFQVSSSSIWILLSLCLSSACCSPRARPFSLSVWGNSLHSHHHSHLGALAVGVCISDSCLFLLIVLNTDNWPVSVSISKACLEVFGPKVLRCSKTYVRVSSELPNSF